MQPVQYRLSMGNISTRNVRARRKKLTAMLCVNSMRQREAPSTIDGRARPNGAISPHLSNYSFSPRAIPSRHLLQCRITAVIHQNGGNRTAPVSHRLRGPNRCPADPPRSYEPTPKHRQSTRCIIRRPSPLPRRHRATLRLHTDGTTGPRQRHGRRGGWRCFLTACRIFTLQPHLIIFPPSLSAQVTRNRTASDVGNLLAITIFPRVFHER